MYIRQFKCVLTLRWLAGKPIVCYSPLNPSLQMHERAARSNGRQPQQQSSARMAKRKLHSAALLTRALSTVWQRDQHC
jgi:hypothetical protein